MNNVELTRLVVDGLTCEYRTKPPLGLDVARPRLGWVLQSERRGTLQTAYQVQVTDAGDRFDSLLWDSGRVDSDQSVHVEYAGPKLQARTRYYYRVKAWDNHGRESAWSAASWWETGLLQPAGGWQAQWIAAGAVSEATGAEAPAQDEPVHMLRKRLQLRTDIRSARIYATAAGVYELYVNGSKVSDDLLAPGWTSYRHRLQYQTYDVTHALSAGDNAIGMLLGSGWYTGMLTWNDNRINNYGDRRAALLQLHVVYTDGTEEVVTTDSSWRSSKSGPIRMSEIYAGEVYDARLEQAGWSEADLDDSTWAAAEAIELPLHHIVAQENWPVRVTETLRPAAVIHTPNGETVLDMGQNMVGRIRMIVDAAAGTTISLRHAEVLDREGNFYTGNLRKAKQVVTYVAGGREGAVYAPTFTFQGFRYVHVDGMPDGMSDRELMDRFAGEVIHSDMPKTGSFECSHPLINRLQSNIEWGQRGNFLDVPTDCPQRDERLGWTGDAQVFVRTAAYNYQVGPFFTKWLRDLQADQRPDGSVPFVVPNVLDENPNGESVTASAAWGDAAVICPWTIYLSYGDRRLLAEQFDSMKAWVEYIRRQGDNEWLWNTGFHFGDWLGLDAKENSYVGATPRDLIATAYYAYSTRLVRDAAVVLGRAEDVRRYSELHASIIAEFRAEFVTSKGRLAAPTQTAHVLALMFDLVEGSDRVRIAHDLNELVKQNDWHLTTGFVGTPYLCFVLSDNGYHDTAVKLLVQESYPSWLYSVTKGATTIWEHWDGIKPDGSFWSDDMNSFNHYAYGAIGDWMYRYVAGLGLDEAAGEAGYKRIRIEPRYAGDSLSHARASLQSPYGAIVSGWRIDEGDVTVDVTIPANATAEIVLRQSSLAGLMEGDGPASKAEGVLSAREEGSVVVLSAGSGTYRFRYKLAQ
jgi:alpha-L-rhamnosidase